MLMSEINKLDKKTIAKKIEETKREVFNLRMQKHTGGLEAHNKYVAAKKTVARLMTALNGKSGK